MSYRNERTAQTQISKAHKFTQSEREVFSGQFPTCDCIQVFVFTTNHHLKVVICGKYTNLNKIIKIKDISLKFHRLLISVILYSLQCKIEGHAVKKSVLIRKDQREFLCAKI